METQLRITDTVGGTIVKRYDLVPGLALVQLRNEAGTSVPAAIAELEKDLAVEYAEPDYWITPQDTTPNDPRLAEMWGLANAHAPAAWDHHTGTSEMVVAVIDMGADYTHPDLANHIWINEDEIAGNGLDDDGNGYIDDIRGYDFYDHDNDPMDAGTHGTHVAGTICAEGDNGIGVVGVLWRCKIMILKFMGPTGGYTSGALDALTYAVAKDVRVSNNSWGSSAYSTPLYEAIQNAQAIGHVYIAAAGNDARDIDAVPLYPASFPLDNIISVGSIQSNETPASTSNYGAVNVDLHAPGVGILSTTAGGGYGNMSGTSMAAPLVTGSVALLLSANPALTFQEVRTVLLESTRPAAALASLSVTGGVLDIDGAFDQMSDPLPPASPTDLVAPVLYLNTVCLAWADNAFNEHGFEVFRSTDQVNWQSIATVGTNATSFDDANLTSGTYAYEVRAFNASGQSDPSNVASAVIYVPLAITVHIGDLDSNSVWQNRTFWQATVTAEVHDMGDEPLPFATVTGVWSGDGQVASCETDELGRCQFLGGPLWLTQTEVTFTVLNVAADMFIYVPPENHDPDGDSNGTSISVTIP
ncbi:MAG: S8 family serine peptidase [Caldilineales bacterium]